MYRSPLFRAGFRHSVFPFSPVRSLGSLAPKLSIRVNNPIRTFSSSSSSASASGSGSSSSSGSSIVPAPPRQVFTPHIPFNSIPRSVSSVPLLAVSAPAFFPGQTFEFPFLSIPKPLRTLLQKQLQSNFPYLALFAHRGAVNAAENIPNPNNANTNGPAASAAGAADASRSSGLGVSIVPIESSSEVYSSGVLCHFFLSGAKLKGGVHRRIRMNESDGAMEGEAAEGKRADPPVFPLVPIVHLDDVMDPADSGGCNAYTKSINSLAVDLQPQPEFIRRAQLSHARLMPNYDYTAAPGRVADFYASCSRAAPGQMQALVELPDVAERLKRVVALLKAEHDEVQWQLNILQKVQEKFQSQQQKHMWKEQKKVIDSFLGLGKSEKETLKNKFEGRIKEKSIPNEVKTVIEEEMAKFSAIEPESHEFNVTRNYLEWLTVLPWGVYSKENFSVKQAQIILDEDHYGMELVKKRILELIAAGRLAGKLPSGKILCLVGPPGVGKTSIGRSIARALGRQFYRFSVGGLDDVAEIKGHRRTYVGAMPGKLIQALKLTQCQNPVVLIDEIDKLGRGTRGDPAAALLELLDPEQNHAYSDHYLDVPVDLSRVLFLCTANTSDTIPAPLADRMEFIELSGYLPVEKLKITQKYLEPVTRQKTGVTAERIDLTIPAVEALIRWYCREAGVRNLEKHIEKIYRKVALRIVKDPKLDKVTINTENLSEFVGKPVYSSDRLYEVTPVGVSMGLAWTPMGGSCIFIESAIADQKKIKKNARNANQDKSIVQGTAEEAEQESGESAGRGAELFCTGQMGDVMKESSSIAYTVAKHYYQLLKPDGKFFHRNRIHLHVPAGAQPKDGPSAGITMTVALLSLALGKPLKHAIAMTGELSLTGRVMPIGGVREKLMAARQAGVNEVILPADNAKDLSEVPDFVKDGILIHFVADIDQVIKLVMPELSGLNLKHKQQKHTKLEASIPVQQPSPPPPVMQERSTV